MNQEVLILQASPRVEIVFYQYELEIRKSESVLIDKTEYAQIKSADFMKGKIPWITGAITAVIDLITGHGAGHWKRGKGNLELVTNTRAYNIELVNYDRDQTAIAVKMIDDKFKLKI